MHDLYKLILICVVVFASYFVYLKLRKNIAIAKAVKQCNIFWGIVLVISFVFGGVKGYQNIGTHAAPFLPLLLLSAFVYGGFYVVIFAIGQFAKWILEKQMKK